MKSFKRLLFFAIVALIAQIANAQSSSISLSQKNTDHDFLISVKGGWDKPFFKHFRPNPEVPAVVVLPKMEYKIKDGFNVGAGFDYYWKWIGVGLDFDYISNKMVFDYDWEGIKNMFGFASYGINEENVNRMFYGLGPNFRYQLPNRKFSAELNTRVGMSSVTGGKILFEGGHDAVFDPEGGMIGANDVLYKFDGFNAKTLLALKGQLRLTYFVHEIVGLSVGAYYMHHFKVPYNDDYAYVGPGTLPPDNPVVYESGYGSVGVFGGLTIRLSPKKKAPKPALVPKVKVPKEPAAVPVPGKIILNGKVVVCGQTTPIPGASVVIVNNNDNRENIVLSDNNGTFSLPIPANTSFTIRAKKENYFSSVTTISAQPVPKKDTSVDVEICMEQMKRDVSIRLNNIHYDLDRAEIRPDAYPELNRVVQFLKDNPDARIELSSHTDSRGTDAYNLDLSQRRAESAKAYIVSQGIDPSRVVSVGYGESRLLNRCKDGVDCSEEEHQLNRRTEMKIINFE